MRLVMVVAALGTAVAGATDRDAVITVQAGQVERRVSRYLTGACIEDVNHEICGGLYSQMVFGESFQEPPDDATNDDVSGMWDIARRGDAEGRCAIEREDPFVGEQSQRVMFESGDGAFGIANRALNRWGMSFVAGRPYEGCVWARAERDTVIWVCLESGDGERILAEQRLAVSAGDWQRLAISLIQTETVSDGRFVMELRGPGSVVLGYALLEPGEWGRFRGLPARRDVAEGLVGQGITVLRYGGSMVNAPEYRWKSMIGPRDRRQPYRGFWYPYSTNGWGIPDFIAFCRAAGFECIPAFNMGETPQDMADFVEYANGPADSEWGARRIADGHAGPFRLKHIELGNEERVDEAYADRFIALADAIWTKDPGIVLVIGDLIYTEPISDPMHVAGAPSGITDLSAHQRILSFVKERGGEVWLDVHVGTEGPGKSAELLALGSVVEAIDKIADGARHEVVVFEFNAGNHQQRRALANAQAIHEVIRLGLPIATSANCLQPDGQNDNGWDQGLLFLNPSKVWLQPPGYVTRMFSRSYEPLLVGCDVGPGADLLDAVATRSKDGRTLVLSVVNPGDEPVTASIRLEGFTPSRLAAEVEELAGPLDATNTAAEPDHIVPTTREWTHHLATGPPQLTLAPHSFTVVRFR